MSAERTPEMSPPESGVKVRMYRLGGLGDCFLLAFPTTDSGARYMLIDCGIFLGTPNGAERLRSVARDIDAATAGHLHTLVVTHEHWDHLSGFAHARETFDQLHIDEAWLAWTEQLDNPLAKRLREKRAFALRAVEAAVSRLRASDAFQAGLMEEVLNFHGGFSADLGLSRTAGLLQSVRDRSSSVRYLYSKEPPVTWEDVPGVRIFTLGPPEDEKLLTQSEPSGVEGEVYERPEALNLTTAFSAAALSSDKSAPPKSADAELFERSFPFDRALGIPLQIAADHKEFGSFFRARYGFSNRKGHGQGWRRINADWLGVGAELALKLDNDTNNTSLVLAIELLPGGKVLLFPGDAQVGNWLSWRQCSWPDGPDRRITGPELLARTALYKVGHHGSHNATLRTHGLEMMVRPDLVAMIPVDEEQAKSKHWSMPFSRLLQRLQEKTQGRILRSDLGIPPRPASTPPDQWALFLAGVDEDPGPDKLWIEFTVTG